MASKPIPAHDASLRVCPECGGELPRRNIKGGKRQVFCNTACKQNHNNRMASRGKALAKIALGWRQTRGSGDLGKFLFGEMQQMLDQWNAEDRVAGRMRADHYASLVTDWHETLAPVRYIDRQG